MMTITTEYLALLTNGLVTLGASIPIGYFYWINRPKSKAFAFWAIGFIIYGLQILSRLLFSFQLADVIPTVMQLGAFAFFIFGTFMLVNEFYKSLGLFIPLLVVGFILNYLGYATFGLGLGILGLYGSIVYGAYIIGHRVGKANVARFIGGWSLLLVSDLLLGVPQVPVAAIDALASLSKIIIIFGMLDQRFTTSLLRLRKPQYGQQNLGTTSGRGYVRVVICKSNTRQRQIDWLNQHLRDGTEEKRLTHLITVYDAPISADAERLSSIYGMTIVRVVPRPFNLPGEEKDDVHRRVIEMGDDQGDFNEFLSLLLEMSVRSKLLAEVTLLGFSWLAKSWGEDKLLSFLARQTSVIKRGDVILTCFLYPELHSQGTIEAYQRLAGETVVI